MSTIGDRLRAYLKHKNIARKDFSKDINIEYNSVTRFITDKRSMRSDTAAKILRYFPDMNARWFITGEGPMEL